MKSLKQFKSELLKDPKVRKEYDALGPEFALIERMIEKRLKRQITQAALARKIGTKQSAISRFESGSYSPTIGFIHKLADALDAKVEIRVS